MLNPKKLMIDLLVVFSGVYIAFLLGNYSENQKTNIQRQKIMISLKNELEYMRAFYPGQEKYQTLKVIEWEAKLDSNKVVDFYGWRYVQPQYNYMVVEYAINSREIGVIDFHLHQQLLAVYQELKRVEYAEEKMTELALNYQPIPSMMDSTQQDYQIMFRHNRFLFKKFTIFASDRASILGRIANKAEEALVSIDENFSSQEIQQIEKEILIKVFIEISDGISEDYMKEVIQQKFPEMQEEDKKEVVAEVKKRRKVE
jgi:hypothetical protein